MFDDKTLLITGGTGTFGNAVLQRFLKTGIRENPRVQPRREETGGHAPRLQQPQAQGSTSATSATTTASRPRSTGVNYVFHAAALKQVPSCEFYPLEALRTNALGAENVLNASISRGVERVIVLSTDKSVYPINAMGISKAMMEKLMVAKARLSKPGGTILCGTRYGNVMASRGSVIPCSSSR
jgi:UDP-glucose 4-epimerase